MHPKTPNSVRASCCQRGITIPPIHPERRRWFYIPEKTDVTWTIVATRSPSYCIQAKLTAEGAPAALQFEVADEMLYVMSTHGEPAAKVRTGTSGPDGQIRVCDLYPGRFRIIATGSTPFEFGAATVSLSDHDLQDLAVDAEPSVAIQGSVTGDDSMTQEMAPLKFAM